MRCSSVIRGDDVDAQGMDTLQDRQRRVATPPSSGTITRNFSPPHFGQDRVGPPIRRPATASRTSSARERKPGGPLAFGACALSAGSASGSISSGEFQSSFMPDSCTHVSVHASSGFVKNKSLYQKVLVALRITALPRRRLLRRQVAPTGGFLRGAVRADCRNYHF